jgi:hypothetical protein
MRHKLDRCSGGCDTGRMHSTQTQLATDAVVLTARETACSDARRVLRALFELARADCPADVRTLARALGMTSLEVVRALLRLDSDGLASADTARLTLQGLAVAARLPDLALVQDPALAQRGLLGRGRRSQLSRRVA